MGPILHSLFLVLVLTAFSMPPGAASFDAASVRKVSHHHLQEFCGQCIWNGNIDCDARAQYLVKTYGDLTLVEARQSIIGGCASDDGQPEEGTTSSISLAAYCGTCKWNENMGFDCNSRVAYLMNNDHLSEEGAQESLLEGGSCIDPMYDPTTDANSNSEGNVGSQSDKGLANVQYGTLEGKENYEPVSRRETSNEEDEDITASGYDLEAESDVNLKVQGEDDGSPSAGKVVGIICVAIILLLSFSLLLVCWRHKKALKETNRVIADDSEHHDLENPAPIVHEVAAATVPMVASPATDVRHKHRQSMSPLKVPPQSPSTLQEERGRQEEAHGNATRSRSPSPEPEIWIACYIEEENSCDKSLLTHDEDWDKDTFDLKPDHGGFAQCVAESLLESTAERKMEDSADETTVHTEDEKFYT